MAITQLLEESGGEYTRTIDEWVKEYEKSLSTKVDAYKFLTEELKARTAFLREQAEEFRAAASSLERLKDNLNDRMKQSMVSTGVDEYRGEKWRYKLSHGQIKLNVDETQVPDEYKRQIISYWIDKDKIKEDLKTKTIPGVTTEPVLVLKSYVLKR